MHFSDNDKTNFGRLNGTKFKKIKRFFDKFGNVAGYAKRTICRFAVQSDAPKPKQILSAIASFTAFGARRASAWLDFEGIATPDGELGVWPKGVASAEAETLASAVARCVLSRYKFYF